jgi:hypothetical protein
MNRTTRPFSRRRRVRTILAASATMLAAATTLSLVPTGQAHAEPLSGATPWAVLLCKTADTSAEPMAPDYYQKLFTSHDSVNPTIWDYWSDVSNNTINLFYSSVSTHWISTSKRVVDLQQETREQKLRDCMDAAGSELANPESYYGVIAMWNVDFTLPTDPPNSHPDSGAIQTGPVVETLNGVTKPYAGAVFEPSATFPSMLEHEMGHGYGLEHAFSTANCGATTQPGEYCDPYDTMGVSFNGYEFSQPAYQAPDGPSGSTSAGPGLTAFNLDKLGWIPAGRRADVGIGVGQQSTVTITSLSAPNPSGFLTVKIPLGDSPDHYYTVEYRRKLKWDAGINDEGIVIHEVKPDYVPNHALPLSYDIPRSTNWRDGVWTPGQTLDDPRNHVSIAVQSVDPVANTATVVVSGSPLPTPPPLLGGGDNGEGAGGCGATGCGQRPPGWHPGPIQFM